VIDVVISGTFNVGQMLCDGQQNQHICERYGLLAPEVSFPVVKFKRAKKGTFDFLYVKETTLDDVLKFILKKQKPQIYEELFGKGKEGERNAPAESDKENVSGRKEKLEQAKTLVT